MKRFVLALALLASPLPAIAQCAASEQAMSCAEGQMWDRESSTCVPVVMG